MMNGWPDMGLLTMTEVAKTASMVASAVEAPIIADADDGYGNALSTMRTVQEFVKTGVAGIHLEDQRFPKRCGHIAGKTVVSREEALGKYRAARRLRRGGRKHGGGDLARASVCRCRGGPRVERALQLRSSARHRVRTRDEADPPAASPRLQLLVFVPLAPGSAAVDFPRAG